MPQGTSMQGAAEITQLQQGPANTDATLGQQTEPDSNFPIQIFKTMAEGAYSSLSTLLSAVLPSPEDAYNIYRLKFRDGNSFITSEMYKRATEGTNISAITTTPWLISKLSFGYLPNKIYVITGTKANITQVADYGEAGKDHPEDPAGRHFFDFTKTLLGRETLMNHRGKRAQDEKTILRKHLINAEPLDIAADTARRRFKQMLAQWDDQVSFQTQITYVGANILGECLLGVPEFPMKHIPELREVGKVLLDPSNPENIQRSARFLAKMNEEFFEQDLNQILQAGKFIPDDLNQMIAEETDPETLAELNGDTEALAEFTREKRADLAKDPAALREKLVSRKAASLYIVESNISTSIMYGLAYLNQCPEVKKRLREEVAAFRALHQLSETDAIPTQDLRKLPYLNCIFHEILRLASSAPALVRKTSVATTLKIENDQGEKVTYPIAANSVLFAPLRSIHHDARIWGPNPNHFNPSRFELPKEPGAAENTPSETKVNKALCDRVVAFSAGKRQCPAQNGFVQVVINAILVASLGYDFVLDKPIEEVPPDALLKPYWLKEYYARVMPTASSPGLSAFCLSSGSR